MGEISIHCGIAARYYINTVAQSIEIYFMLFYHFNFDTEVYSDSTAPEVHKLAQDLILLLWKLTVCPGQSGQEPAETLVLLNRNNIVSWNKYRDSVGLSPWQPLPLVATDMYIYFKKMWNDPVLNEVRLEQCCLCSWRVK